MKLPIKLSLPVFPFENEHHFNDFVVVRERLPIPKVNSITWYSLKLGNRDSNPN